jgi:hypothetical protein
LRRNWRTGTETVHANTYTHTHTERESGISYVMSCTVFFFPTPINHEGENGYEKKKAEDSFSGIFVSRAGTVTIHLPISEEIPERFPPNPHRTKFPQPSPNKTIEKPTESWIRADKNQTRFNSTFFTERKRGNIYMPVASASESDQEQCDPCGGWMIREETRGREEGTSTARRWSSSPPCPFSPLGMFLPSLARCAGLLGAPSPAVSARFYYSGVALPQLANWKPTLPPLYLLFLPYVTCS